MDVRRSILFVGLAIVSYMLILAWNEDYGQQSTIETAQVSTVEPSFESNIVVKKTNEDDFSVPEDTNSDSFVKEASEHQRTTQFIQITTDLLDIKIDLSGGNIISTSMFEYDSTLGSDSPLALLQKNQYMHYIVESGLFGKNGLDSAKNGPSPVYSSNQESYKLEDGQNQLAVDLNVETDTGVSIIKRYQFNRDDYLIKVSYIIKNESTDAWEANFSGKIVRDQSGDPSEQSSMGMQSFLGMALSSSDKPYEKYDFDNMLEDPINTQIKGGWVAFIQHYFLSAWIPNTDITHTYQSRVKNGLYLMGFISPATIVEAGQQTEISAKLYLGPKIIEKLEIAAPNLDLTVDFGWLFFIATPLFLLMDFLYGIVQNWGLAIILVTVVVKALFFKLSAASYRSMANMRRVAPKLKSMKEQYGDDRQKMSQAMMALYKKEKINPLGGCLPILVQMPVFIALYWVLLESVQLRHAPFMFWITDLSVKDAYFVLPILMGISMFIQMQLNPAPPDPMQAKVMKIMPVMMTVFFLWFPAGLVLYWLVNNVLSITQQWIITRQIEKEHA